MRLPRKNAQSISDVLLDIMRSSRMGASHNTERIFAAWDSESGAAAYTLKKFFRDGKLYITLSSSVVRTGLRLHREELRDRINLVLSNDPLFIPDNPHVGMVKEIVLK